MSLKTVLAATVLAILLASLCYAGWTIRRLHRRQTILLYAASHDPLTSLPNRAHAKALFEHHVSGKQPTIVALLDLDEFKQVNDTFGHQAGDLVLTTIAARLATAATGQGGHAARLAGDEFLLLLPVGQRDPIDTVATIAAELSAPVAIGADAHTLYTPRASTGITLYDGTHGTWTTILRQADIACYHAKTSRSSHEVFSPGMHLPADRLPRPAQRLRDHDRQVQP